jgi:hypothetical protein
MPAEIYWNDECYSWSSWSEEGQGNTHEGLQLYWHEGKKIKECASNVMTDE